MKRKTVNEMFDYARNNNLKLLSDFEANFWQEYLTNHSQYDALFRRMFFSFKYYLQYGDESVETVTNDFINEVKHHLMLNKKKYEELYRVYTLADENYSLTENYDVTETMKKETGSTDNNTYGSRQDTLNYNKGAQSNDTTEQVTTFDSDSFNDDRKYINSDGARVDNSTNTKGEQKDTLINSGTENYTYTKKGNIGVQTVTDMISKHEKFWSGYMFYEKIFEDICAELLIV